MITFERFPNKPIVAVNVDGERVGTYEIVEGGFLPQGRKKPLAKENDARFMVIADEAGRRLRDANRLMDSVLKAFLRYEPTEPTEALSDAGEVEYRSWGDGG